MERRQPRCRAALPEKGRQNASALTLIRLASALRVLPSELFVKFHEAGDASPTGRRVGCLLRPPQRYYRASISKQVGTSKEYDAFTALVDKVLSVPKEEIIRREAEYRKRADANPRKRGPKPKTKS